MSLIEERKALALSAIKESFDTKAGEDGVTLFVDHDLEEVEASYWKQHLGNEKPERSAVLTLLVFKSSWGRDDAEYFDFTLPEETTNYVVSVHFDREGTIYRIEMES
ncbi:MAG: DUF2004 domain-containing protein [Stenotrophomonas sp.]|nr:DUF2004 domain-containing protein [Stenotrophomonas sp.]